MTTEAETTGWSDLNTYTTVGLLAHLDYLRKQRAYKEAANLIIEVRAYELRIAAAERMLAIHNRRATEAEDQNQGLGIADVLSEGPLTDEVAWKLIRGLVGCEVAEGRLGNLLAERMLAWMDQRVAEERPSGVSRLPSRVLHILADYRRRLQAEPSSLTGYDQTEQEERRQWIAGQIARIDEVFAGQQLETVCEFAPAHPTLTEERVREVLCETFAKVSSLSGESFARRVIEDIATRAAKELAGAVVVDPAQREADLREAFLAGCRRTIANEVADQGAGFSWARPEPEDVERWSAEYARSKAGG